MSESGNEQTDGPEDQQDEGVGITDEQLPEELLPSEDNPLAEPLSDEEAPEDIDELDMMGSGSSDDSGENDGADGSSTDGEPPRSDDED